MEKEVILLKKRILKKINQREYRELLEFVREIYLADAPLKVLLARKCSNLFLALIELAKQEDGGVIERQYNEKFEGREKPVIISDRALCYHAEAICNGVYSQIMIVDDVVMRGTTIEKIYNIIKGYNENAEIDVLAFAANEEILKNNNIISKSNVHKSVPISKCKVITDNIVSVLYCVGQPYTSYVPNMRLTSDTQETDIVETMSKAIHDNNFKKNNNVLKEKLDINLQTYVTDQWGDFSLFQSIRVYPYEEEKSYVMVPMISLMPIQDETLDNMMQVLRPYFDKAYFAKMPNICREMSYRAIIYLLSTIWGKCFLSSFLHDVGNVSNIINHEEEKMNFGNYILNCNAIDRCTSQDVERLVNKLNDLYKPIPLKEILEIHSDFKCFEQEKETILNEGDTNSKIYRFLRLNGELEENVVNGGQERLLGYPLSGMQSLLQVSDFELDELYRAILESIDGGKGSIIAKKIKTYKGDYYISLLHSGERNYKFIESKYYDFLYGLYEIERRVGEKNIDVVSKKLEFARRYFEDVENIDRYERDIVNLCNSNVTLDYEYVLIYDTWNMSNDASLKKSFKLIKEII